MMEYLWWNMEFTYAEGAAEATGASTEGAAGLATGFSSKGSVEARTTTILLLSVLYTVVL